MAGAAAGSRPNIRAARPSSQPARWIGQQRSHDVRRVALDPDPRRFGKGGGQDFAAADVPAGALEHQVPFIAVPASAQRPHQKPHQAGPAWPRRPDRARAREARSAVKVRRGRSTPGSVPSSRDTSVDPHRERWKIMPAGSSDGSLSRATSASSPVLTSGLACGPVAQRATVWSKNGSTKRSAERSAQSTVGAGPEKSNLIGVQRARSAIAISRRAAGRGIHSRSGFGPVPSAPPRTARAGRKSETAQYFSRGIAARLCDRDRR